MKLRLLCFSDLHRDLGAAQALSRTGLVGGFDLLLCAGDLAVDGAHEPGLTTLLSRAGTEILAVPGNHDGEGYPAELAAAGWTDLHDQLLQRGQWWFAGFGLVGSPPGTGEEPADADRMLSLLRRAEAVPKDRLVLVTHLPPAGTLAARDRRFVDRGSALLAEWVARHQPAALVCGHVHHPEPVVDRIGGTVVVLGGPRGHALTCQAP
ncbi:metallophosphoesterase family protein [Anaeromyxobacter paludicola]|uniref:Metallophosphoesterase n=1 Tax=Anaeromyxobacter paludicola TaxID=2918171 RepID=A0ABN6N5Y7_9BACT|nr:metallophosphoesterase [Anaeromyxobacter paludicola]BDG08588.1 metallophosphoesterase [Anaeromyxobacter paludicola]